MRETDITECFVAIDAGVSTGIVIAGAHTDGSIEILHYDQFVCDNYLDTVTTITSAVEDIAIELGLFQCHFTIIMEQFDLRPQNKFIADLTTVKVNAALEYELTWHWTLTEEIVYQTPAQAKGLVKNSALKNLGWYLTGRHVSAKDANDVNDAMRHLVYYLVKEKKNKWVAEGGWPK